MHLGVWEIWASPSKKSVQRVRTKIGDLLTSSKTAAWPNVRKKLNRLLAGWTAYFGYGTRLPAYRAVDNHVYERVRNFLVRRHKMQGRGVGQFPREKVHGELGVLCLRRVHLRPPP